MKTIKDLTEKEQQLMKRTALNYLDLHRGQVKAAVRGAEYITAPSGSDIFAPHLWKPSHWKWFMFVELDK